MTTEQAGRLAAATIAAYRAGIATEPGPLRNGSLTWAEAMGAYSSARNARDAICREIIAQEDGTAQEPAQSGLFQEGS